MYFNDEILEKLYCDKEMRTIPCGCQSTAIHTMERILEDLAKEKPYATISELFSKSESISTESVYE